ncbi:cytochrome c oxidase assembly protein [Streptomyces sp. NBC_01166]|uniref:cytochrome c oxidase assembly protein n=1 Tax=Streptomyces sp. NBC_01166 TaxID=2903755 RepID=UPI003869210C|nr:cytochrome c oxidase assembly protein [Streptomyces sp. NBC_01166]
MGGDAHHTHGHGRGGSSEVWEVLLPLTAVLLSASGYLLLVHRAHGRNPVRRWSRWRTAGFLTGCALLGAALLPPVSTFAHQDFRGHMAQHLLIGMYAPLVLVLGAPVTLLLRTLSAARARRLTGLLHNRPVRVATHPVSTLVLSTGTLVVLYSTPVYNATMDAPGAHRLVLAHFLLSGCLFAHAIAGPDPAPGRPGVPARLVALGVAVAAHATISQLMYGGFLIDVRAPVGQVQGGAELMYYGGDIAELLLAGALVATWRPSPRRGQRTVARHKSLPALGRLLLKPFMRPG